MNFCGSIGEAFLKKNMKKLLLLFALLTTCLSFGQDIKSLEKAQQQIQSLDLLSDEELLAYWTSAQQQGYSLTQLKTLARAQGASEADIAKFEKRIKNLNKLESSDKTEEGSNVENDLTSIFGVNPKQNDDENKGEENVYSGLNIFGMDFFKNFKSIENLSENSSTSPQINVATPSSYQIGPGDELKISIWGGSENEYITLVSREGVIKIDRIAPIYVSGSTINSAKIKIGRALSKIYSGINSSNESYQKVFFDVSLANSRSIIINLVGAVERPGTYTLSSMSSVLNALSAAGGPTENGSFRAIKILRNGKTHKLVDLYDYFVKGAFPSLTLRDQDVILVPNYKNRVFVEGEFKTTGIFEFLEEENADDLLSFTGGFSSFAYKGNLFIESVSGISRSIKTVSSDMFSQSIVNDGDIVKAKAISDKYDNKVSIEGAVYVPGDYPVGDAGSLFELLTLSGGVKEDALLSRAVIFRQEDGVEKKMVSFSVSEIFTKKNNVDLLPNDRVVIFSKTSIEEKLYVTLKGEVNHDKTKQIGLEGTEGRYPFYQGMTVSDLILIANGIKNNGSMLSIDVFRRPNDASSSEPFVSLGVELSDGYGSFLGDKNLVLQKEDLVVVRKSEGFLEPEFVNIEGLVKRPGTYSVLSSKYSLYDLLIASGGLLEDASIKGIKIKRINTAKKIIEEAFVAEDSLGFAVREQKDFLEFGVNIEALFKTKGTDIRYNVILKDGDVVVVPKVDNTIEVVGEVGQPTVIAYQKNMRAKDAIKKAGGLNDLAKKSGVFVIYKNGNVLTTNHLLGIFNKSPILEPGAKVVVPRKVPNPNKTSVTELIGITSTLATLTVLIRSL